MPQPAGQPHQALMIRSISSKWLMLLITLFFAGSQCNGGTQPRMVEIRDDSTTYVGKVVAKDADSCVLIDRYGVMSELPISGLKSFTVVSESFKPASTSAFMQKLLKEFPAGYEVKISAHYVVCGGQGRTEAYAGLFEEIFRQIASFYSVRRFGTAEPEVPLVAIVFATQDEFREYCERDAMKWTDTLRGYYSPKSNRVALYDDPGHLNSVTGMSPRSVETYDSAATPGQWPSRAVSRHTQTRSPVFSTVVEWRLRESPLIPESRLVVELPDQMCSSHNGAALLNSITGETANTIIHETTHQVGYNIGIHSRLGATPTWLIEGLATLLEAPGMRVRGKSATGTKINSGRLEWFTGEYQSRRKPGDLARMAASDDMFRNETLDAYSSAWAFTWFMTENPARARQFSSYLKTVTERDPLKQYTADERLSDFTAAFGDIARLEVELMRTIDGLESP